LKKYFQLYAVNKFFIANALSPYVYKVYNFNRISTSSSLVFRSWPVPELSADFNPISIVRPRAEPGRFRLAKADADRKRAFLMSRRRVSLGAGVGCDARTESSRVVESACSCLVGGKIPLVQGHQRPSGANPRTGTI
jgi:hypothetical protein